MRQGKLWILGLAVAGCLLGTARAGLPGLPAAVTLPADVGLYDPEGGVAVETLAEAEFPVAEGKNVTKKGKHYRTYLKWKDADQKPVGSFWPSWLAALKGSGWTLAGNNGATTYTLVRKAAGTESWLMFGLGDYVSPLVELIEISSASAGMTLVPPAAKPEAFTDRDDFPYLGHPAGAQLTGTGVFNEPLDVTDGAVDREPVLAGTAYRLKTYQPPPSLSRYEFESQYRDALTRAGWTVRPPTDGKIGSGEVIAHYAKNGRNIWARLGRGADNSNIGIGIKVADVGAEDWGARLDKNCHLPLYGVLFDFNRDTLRPDSTPVLEKTLVLLQARAQKPAEIQGHTDNVGDDAYNLKLSNARAASVVRWLVQHGIPPGRLTAKGFGKTQPIADNGSDEGRARNRRVELAIPGCHK
jgi:OOP family OmpA-OmpF porin